MAAYTVTATRLYHLEEGVEVRYFRGDTVEGLTPDEVKRYRDAGAIAAGSSSIGKAAVATPEANPDEAVETIPLTHHGDGIEPSLIVAIANGAAVDQGDGELVGFVHQDGDDDDPAGEVVTTVNPDDDAEVGVDKLPPDSATKPRWVTAAVARGWTEAGADALTREQLRDAVKSNATPQ